MLRRVPFVSRKAWPARMTDLQRAAACRFSSSSVEDQINSTTVQDTRNFSIIAHIDHGKSTLADHLLMMAGNITQEEKVDEPQMLDSLQVERERGITVKASTASIFFDLKAGEHHEELELEGKEGKYLLNLIDTPGHVDFSYAVTQSLQACEGALLLVDSSQGVQAQTLANFNIALKAGLDIIPVLTKIDLPHSMPEEIKEDLERTFGISPADVLTCSAKSGVGVDALYPAIVNRIAAPSGKPEAPMRAMISQSWFDTYKGVICLVKVIDGTLSKGDVIATFHSKKVYEVAEVGVLTPARMPMKSLRTGQVGYVICGIKSTREVTLGDTMFKLGGAKDMVKKSQWPSLQEKKRQSVEAWPGFASIKSMVFAGIFPSQDGDFEDLRVALEKIMLTDPSVSMEQESSVALGLGFRCGFLGALHMEVFTQRLEQEFATPVVMTSPTVPFSAKMKNGTLLHISGPNTFPTDITSTVDTFMEPWVRASIIAPEEYMGEMMTMCDGFRGNMIDLEYYGADRVHLTYEFPLSEIVSTFYDKLKSLTSGYASFDYDRIEDQPVELCCITVQLNKEDVDAFAVIVPRMKVDSVAREMAVKLRDNITRQMFQVHIQIMNNGKVIASEKISPFRKDVLNKSGKMVGGGDSSRKKKLLEKQKEGKKRMKFVGSVELEEKVFMAVVK